MSAVLAWVLSSPAVLAILGGIMAAIMAFMKGRWSGAARERERRLREELKARDMADEIEDAIAGRSPDENRKRLRGWKK